MLALSPQLLSGFAILLLGLFSVAIRWLGDLPLQYTGSDLTFSAASLQLGLVFRKLELKQPSDFDVLVVLVFLILWAVALRLAKDS